MTSRTRRIESELYTLNEAAQELRVSRATLRRKLARGELDYIHVGGQYRIPADALRSLRVPATNAPGRDRSETRSAA